MICIGIYELNRKNKDAIRNSLRRYHLQTEIVFEPMWLMEKNMSEKFKPEHARRLHIAFISLDIPDGAALGDRIYRMNPDCRICFYREKNCDLEPLLSSRPIAFYLWKSDDKITLENGSKQTIVFDYNSGFSEKLNEIIQELRIANRVFSFETKKNRYIFTTDQILYFRSNLKYVEVYNQKGLECSFFAKLSTVEEDLHQRGLEDHFLRVHKSFIVNVKHIIHLDKEKHVLALSDGNCIPISDAQYNTVIKKLSDLI